MTALIITLTFCVSFPLGMLFNQLTCQNPILPPYVVYHDGKPYFFLSKSSVKKFKADIAEENKKELEEFKKKIRAR